MKLLNFVAETKLGYCYIRLLCPGCLDFLDSSVNYTVKRSVKHAVGKAQINAYIHKCYVKT